MRRVAGFYFSNPFKKSSAFIKINNKIYDSSTFCSQISIIFSRSINVTKIIKFKCLVLICSIKRRPIHKPYNNIKKLFKMLIIINAKKHLTVKSLII